MATKTKEPAVVNPVNPLDDLRQKENALANACRDLDEQITLVHTRILENSDQVDQLVQFASQTSDNRMVLAQAKSEAQEAHRKAEIALERNKGRANEGLYNDLLADAKRKLDAASAALVQFDVVAQQAPIVKQRAALQVQIADDQAALQSLSLQRESAIADYQRVHEQVGQQLLVTWQASLASVSKHAGAQHAAMSQIHSHYLEEMRTLSDLQHRQRLAYNAAVQEMKQYPHLISALHTTFDPHESTINLLRAVQLVLQAIDQDGESIGSIGGEDGFFPLLDDLQLDYGFFQATCQAIPSSPWALHADFGGDRLLASKKQAIEARLNRLIG